MLEVVGIAEFEDVDSRELFCYIEGRHDYNLDWKIDKRFDKNSLENLDNFLYYVVKLGGKNLKGRLT